MPYSFASAQFIVQLRHWSMWSFRSFGIVAIAGVKPDLIPEIVVSRIVVIVRVVGASGVSI